jgi:hypothetical protein
MRCGGGGEPAGGGGRDGIVREPRCTVRVFQQKFTLEDAIEFHAFAPLEALPCV